MDKESREKKKYMESKLPCFKFDKFTDYQSENFINRKFESFQMSNFTKEKMQLPTDQIVPKIKTHIYITIPEIKLEQ